MERDLSLMGRNEGTRDHTIIRFTLDEVKMHFSETILDIKALSEVVSQLMNDGKTEDAENIRRAQVVFLASALDFYMHELTKYGLCKIYDGDWDRTRKYENIQVSMRVVIDEVLRSDNTDWFLDFVNNYYQTVTMVSYESVKDQLNLLGIDVKKVADGAFYKLNETEKTEDKLKRRLNELFFRRNHIAHQTDREHSDAQLMEISSETTEDFISDTEKIVLSIDKSAREISATHEE